MKYFNKHICILFIFTLTACSTAPSRYSQKHDSIPDRLPTSAELVQPEPQVVAKSRGGNKDYNVWGKDYQVMDSAEGYKASGVASWYGSKFHGHLTSNGEVYDMYGFSAAHKSLPLPIYLQVTNIANNKKIIVRVNDRGPFHQDRLIDLSYSAAYELDMLDKGTAQVKIEAITATNISLFTSETKGVSVATAVPKPSLGTITPLAKQPMSRVKSSVNSEQSQTVQKPVSENQSTLTFDRFIHVLVTRDKLLADNTARGLTFLMQVPVSLTEKNELFRVQVGPIESAQQARAVLANLQKQGYPEAYPLNSPK